MAVNTKAIKRRIKSIGSTKKITRAMEMISAVKMRKAVAQVLSSRHYAELAWNLLTAIAEKTDVSTHPLLLARPVKRVAVVLVTSNRGLAGGFSSRLLQEVDRFVKQQSAANIVVEVVLMGRRGRKIFQRFGHTVAAEFDKIDLTTRAEEVLPMARSVLQDYTNGSYDAVVLAYTDFVSAIVQQPRLKQLLPLQRVQDSFLGAIGQPAKSAPPAPAGPGDLLFEPNPSAVLQILLPRLAEMQIYQAVLESDASEHSARMVAMKNATDAAEDMIKELQYNYNKARQAAITQEIAEIVGGAAGLG